MGDNLLTGSVPTDFTSRCTELQVLNLNDNKLTGRLPTFASKTIAKLNLRNNRFSGEVPAWYGTQPFYELQLALNHLSCDLPRTLRLTKRDLSLGNWTVDAMEYTDPPPMLDVLTGNRFSCPLPADIAMHDDTADSYSCGYSSIIEPIEAAGLCLALLAVTAYLHRQRTSEYEGSSQLPHAEWESSVRQRSVEARAMAAIALLTVLTLVPVYATSQCDYTCRYASKISASGAQEQAGSVLLALLYVGATIVLLFVPIAEQEVRKHRQRQAQAAEYVLFTARDGVDADLASRMSEVLEEAELGADSVMTIKRTDEAAVEAEHPLAFGRDTAAVLVHCRNADAEQLQLQLQQCVELRVMDGVEPSARCTSTRQVPSPDAVLWAQVLGKKRAAELPTSAKYAIAGFYLVLAIGLALAPNVGIVVVQGSTNMNSRTKNTVVTFLALLKSGLNVVVDPFLIGMAGRSLRFADRCHLFDHTLAMMLLLQVVNTLFIPFAVTLTLEKMCFYYSWHTPAKVELQMIQEMCLIGDGNMSKYNITGCAALGRAQNAIPPFTALDFYGYDVQPMGAFDNTCPSALVDTYGPVMFQLLFFSNLLQPLMLLLKGLLIPAKKAGGQKKDDKKKEKKSDKKKVGNGKKKKRMPAVLMINHIARSFNMLMLVLTFGFVYPPVAIAAPLVMLGRQYCTQLLVMQEASDGHEWKYQGSTNGLPLSAMVVLLTMQCLFMFFFIGFGTLVPQSHRLLSLLPALAAVVGSMLAYRRVREGDADSRTTDPLLAKMKEEEEERNTTADPLLAGQGESGMERYHSSCTINSGVGQYRRSLAEWRGQRSSGDDEEPGVVDDGESSNSIYELSVISGEDSDQDQD
jgi:hypothetical protein